MKLNEYEDVLVRIKKDDWYVEDLLDDLLCIMNRHLYEVRKPKEERYYEFRGYLNMKWFRRLSTLQAMSPIGNGYVIFVKRFSFETYRDEWELVR